MHSNATHSFENSYIGRTLAMVDDLRSHVAQDPSLTVHVTYLNILGNTGWTPGLQ